MSLIRRLSSGLKRQSSSSTHVAEDPGRASPDAQSVEQGDIDDSSDEHGDSYANSHVSEDVDANSDGKGSEHSSNSSAASNRQYAENCYNDSQLSLTSSADDGSHHFNDSQLSLDDSVDGYGNSVFNGSQLSLESSTLEDDEESDRDSTGSGGESTDDAGSIAPPYDSNNVLRPSRERSEFVGGASPTLEEVIATFGADRPARDPSSNGHAFYGNTTLSSNTRHSSFRDDPESENQGMRALTLQMAAELKRTQQERGDVGRELQSKEQELANARRALSKALGKDVRAFDKFVRGPAGPRKPRRRASSKATITSRPRPSRSQASNKVGFDGFTDFKTAGQFLYDGMSEHLLEMTISLLLVRTRVALVKHEWIRAEGLAMEAVRAAENLGYTPLVGRCWFWVGIAQFRRQDYVSASDSFGLAKKFLHSDEIHKLYTEEEMVLEKNAALTMLRMKAESRVMMWT